MSRKKLDNIKFTLILLSMIYLIYYFSVKIVLKSKRCNTSNINSIGEKLKNFQNETENDIDNLFFGDNITGYPYPIVPNIVHNVLFNIQEIKFSHFISLLSILKNQMPKIIYIHCNCQQLSGVYYKRLIEKSRKSRTHIIVRQIKQPTQIFGRNLSEGSLNWHSADITRLRVLSQFGGIYLDNDVYVVKSLDVFRKFEMTLNWDEGQYLGNQVLIAHRNSRFLHRYINSYVDYDAEKWYYNAGDWPTISILYKYPELVHRVKGGFGVDAPVVCPKIYSFYYEKLKDEFYTVHLVMRGNEITWKDWCFGDNKPAVMEFDEKNVMNLNNTFGEMCRDVLQW